MPLRHDLPFDPAGARHEWWRETTVYQVYPRSFADSNGDGIGDVRGIIDRLDYLAWLGVETLWLSPLLEGPEADLDGDSFDRRSLRDEEGTLFDLLELVEAVHARGMKLVLDMVLDHTPIEHPWFQASRSDRHAPLRDFYIWRPGRARGRPPTEACASSGVSGWHYDTRTDEWFWASSHPYHPDLNYRNPLLRLAMLDVVRTWLEHGIDGLRLDLFQKLLAHGRHPSSAPDDPAHRSGAQAFDVADAASFARELRAVVDSVSGPPRLLVGEIFGRPAALEHHARADGDGAHLVFLFQALGSRFSARAVEHVVRDLEHRFPAPSYSPAYVFGQHDRSRVLTRVGRDPSRQKLLALLQLTTRGVPLIYFGEEIGLSHHDVPLHEGLDPGAARHPRFPEWLVRFLRARGVLMARDECRLPMAWDASPNAGFTAPGVKPWLPLHPESASTNVAAQKDEPDSTLHCYRSLLALRRSQAALRWGCLRFARRPARHVLAYRRVLANEDDVVDVLLNFGTHPIEVAIRRAEGRSLFSTACCGTSAATPRRELGPFEGIVVYRPASHE
ncbi:MAG TPA: alpha-amylase family glycosyl hydrolase [Polyangiaceae bacterium]|nr:alpha-amylase family glycosyl hydrolase [Polyangiaceae bacterium]